jgi:CubicO group peptidase (beta-lactamase class C family)
MDLFYSPDFSSHVEKLIKEHHVPGLAIAIVQGGTIASAGYGTASLDPPTPCTADTLFDIASASKSLTAAAVSLLVSDNEKHPEVQYEATLSSLLPDDFVMSDERYTKEVTVEDILSHRSGMAP